MSYAPDYEKSTNFASSLATVGQDLDAELTNIAQSVSALNQNQRLITREDGKLANGSVHFRALDSSSLAVIMENRWNPRGDWATTTAYALYDLVTNGTGTYVCISAHTSGTFSADLALNYWHLVFDSASSLLDEDDFASNSDTQGATQQSIGAYVDSRLSPSGGVLIDEDDFASNSPTRAPTQQSAKAYVDGKLIDEDDMVSDSDAHAPTQQSVKAYVDGSVGDVYNEVSASGALSIGTDNYVKAGNLALTLPLLSSVTEGQKIKVRLTVNAYSTLTDGNVVSVSHHASDDSGSEVATFTSIGDGATFVKVDSAWVVVDEKATFYGYATLSSNFALAGGSSSGLLPSSNHSVDEDVGGFGDSAGEFLLKPPFPVLLEGHTHFTVSAAGETIRPYFYFHTTFATGDFFPSDANEGEASSFVRRFDPATYSYGMAPRIHNASGTSRDIQGGNDTHFYWKATRIR